MRRKPAPSPTIGAIRNEISATRSAHVVGRKNSRQRVTGLTVNQQVSIPREERRRFKAILANCRKHGVESQARGRKDFAGWLRGYAAYVRMVHPELGERWQREVKELLGA